MIPKEVFHGNWCVVDADGDLVASGFATNAEAWRWIKRIDGYWNGVMFERCNADGSPIIPVNTVPMSQILGQPKEEPWWVGFRPAKRPDGWPTRNSVEWWSDGEKAIAEAMRVIEHIPGGSTALTDAVTLLAKARARVADHVEGCDANGKPAVPVDAIAAALAHDAKPGSKIDWSTFPNPDKLVCNVVPGPAGRVNCIACGNTWDAKLGVTGCVQGGHGGFAEPRRESVGVPAPSLPNDHLTDWKWLAGENARLRHDAVEAMKEVQADNNRLCVEHTKALEGELLLRMDVLKDNERLRAEHEKAIRHGADQWRAKDLAQARADRLWKALDRIVKADGCGCRPVCVCESRGHLLIWKDEVQDIASEAFREDAAITAGVEPSKTKIDPELEAELLKGLEPKSEFMMSYAGGGPAVDPAIIRAKLDEIGPGRDECDGLPETTLMGPIGDSRAARAEHTVDGVERYAMCGHATYIHAPGHCPLSLGPETVGDAKEFGAAAAFGAMWKSCGCPVIAHPKDQCTAAPKFVAHHDRRAEEIRKRASAMQDLPDTDPIECPSCCHVGGHEKWCIMAPPPPRMVQIAVLPRPDGLGVGIIHALDDRGRIWCRGDGTWFELILPDGFET